MKFGFVAYVDCKNGTHTVLLSWNATDVPSTPPDNKDGLFLMFDIIVTYRIVDMVHMTHDWTYLQKIRLVPQQQETPA